MLTCEACQNLMTDRLYEELDDAHEEDLQQHLQSCDICESELQELLLATRQLKEAGIHGNDFSDIPERAALDGIWQTLEPALDKIDADRYRLLPKNRMTPFLAFASALAASVIVFVAATLIVPTDSGPEPQLALTEMINPELMSYLDRAQVMLLLVANAETDTVETIPIRQSFARDMAFEASLLNTSLDSGSSSGQRKLLRDIEFLLMQIANLDESNMAEGIALLQNYLEANSVLFKIRLLEMRDQDLVI